MDTDKLNQVERKTAVFEKEMEFIRKDLDSIAQTLKQLADVGTDIKLMRTELQSITKMHDETTKRIHIRIDEIIETNRVMESMLRKEFNEKLEKLNKEDEKVFGWFEKIAIAVITGLLSILCGLAW